MKIIAIVKNFKFHYNDSKKIFQEKPHFFLKPETSILRKNEPFFYPNFSNEIHYEAGLILKICKLGRNISEKFAHRYYNEIGIAIDFTAVDLQKNQKANEMPLEISKSFDYSFPLGTFLKKSKFDNLNNINFKLLKNGKIYQKGNSKDMIFSFDKIISYVSKFITLKIGDLIFTGTPKGKGEIKIGDNLKAYIEEENLLNFMIK